MSKKESEFKKRIEKAKSAIVAGYILIPEVNEIVDEAKQEIEKWRQKRPFFVAKKQTEQDYTDEDEFYKARDDWLYEGMTILERWFGLKPLW